MSPDPAQDRSRPHSWLRIWAEIAGAWAIALAHPIYVQLASGPEALTSYAVRRLDVFALIIVVSLVGPLMIALAELVVRRLFGEQVRRIVHGVVIGALIGLVLWQWLRDEGSGEILRTLVPLVVAGLVAWLYVRTELVRNFALMLSFATIVVIGAFCLDYPVRDEVFPHEAKADIPKIEQDTPVVIVVFDEFPLAAIERPDGTIDPRFETLAMLSRKATWYPEALGVADQTTFALPSILTGQDPDPAGGLKPPPSSLAKYPNSICRIARDGGYEVHSYEPITDLCERDTDFGTRITATLRRALGADSPYIESLLPGELDKKLVRRLNAPFSVPPDGFNAERRDSFDRFIDDLPDSKRSLSMLHMTLPHVAWNISPDGTVYDNLRNPGDDMLVNPENQGEVDRNAQQMMLQLEYTDRALGRLVRRMKEQGTWEESLFIVTADHGAAFAPGSSRRMLNLYNAGWVAPVPLFIKYPGQEKGRIVPGTVDGRDIVPTVMSTLGLEALPEQTGRDLTGRERLPTKTRHQMVAAIGGLADLDLDLVRSEKRQAERYMHELLGESFFAPGGRAGLLGKRPAGLEEIPCEATNPSLYEAVDPASGNIPAYFQAEIEPPGGQDPGVLAVALNGRIAATARPWKADGRWFVGVNLPTGAFREGANEIRVYEARPGR